MKIHRRALQKRACEVGARLRRFGWTRLLKPRVISEVFFSVTSRPLPKPPTHHHPGHPFLVLLPSASPPSLTMAVQAQYPSDLLFHGRCASSHSATRRVPSLLLPPPTPRERYLLAPLEKSSIVASSHGSLCSVLFYRRGEPERRKEMDMPTPPQLAGVSPAAVYFSGSGGVCVCLMLTNRRTPSRGLLRFFGS
jgi:hypothetical protein